MYKPNFKSGFLDLGLTFSKTKGGGTSVPMSKNLMRFQSEQWRGNTQWFNENGYKFLRQGLINADYNPILAIGSQPLDGAMPNATATEPTTSFSYDGAAGMQANTARKISDSQISVNKATANKLAEEALTQENVRSNLDSQSLLNMLQSERIQKLLPYDVQKTIAEIAVLDSTANLNSVNSAYVPYNAESTRIQSNAAKKNADVNEQWTPAKIAAGSLAGLIGALGIGKFGKIAKPFMKNAKNVVKPLGKNSYRSSSAQYYTTLH